MYNYNLCEDKIYMINGTQCTAEEIENICRGNFEGLIHSNKIHKVVFKLNNWNYFKTDYCCEINDINEELPKYYGALVYESCDDDIYQMSFAYNLDKNNKLYDVYIFDGNISNQYKILEQLMKPQNWQ